MPWLPELFSVPVLQRLQETWRHELVTVPFFDGLMAGEVGALVGSFAGEPQLRHPVRGRIRGARAFEVFVIETNEWLSRRKWLGRGRRARRREATRPWGGGSPPRR